MRNVLKTDLAVLSSRRPQWLARGEITTEQWQGARDGLYQSVSLLASRAHIDFDRLQLGVSAVPRRMAEAGTPVRHRRANGIYDDS